MYGSSAISGISLTSFNNISYKCSSLRYVMTADSIESLIGAIYLDGGFANAKKFINTFWGPYFDINEKDEATNNLYLNTKYAKCFAAIVLSEFCIDDSYILNSDLIKTKLAIDNQAQAERVAEIKKCFPTER